VSRKPEEAQVLQEAAEIAEALHAAAAEFEQEAMKP
jgi:hypothetical protein